MIHYLLSFMLTSLSSIFNLYPLLFFVYQKLSLNFLLTSIFKFIIYHSLYIIHHSSFIIHPQPLDYNHIVFIIYNVMFIFSHSGSIIFIYICFLPLIVYLLSFIMNLISYILNTHLNPLYIITQHLSH